MRRPLLTIAVAVVVVAAVFLAYSVITADNTDPRTIWAAAADEACITAAVSRSEILVPADLRDATMVRQWAAQHSAVETALAQDLSGIAADGDDVTALAETVITEAQTRAALYDSLAAPDSQPPNLETGEGSIGADLTASHETAVVALKEWGAAACAGGTEEDPVVESAGARWARRTEAACTEAAAPFARADKDAATTGDVETYLRAVSSTAGALGDELGRIGGPPNGDEAWNELLAAVNGVATAAQRGELNAAIDANTAWRDAAERLELGICATGVAAEPETPSNILALRAEIAPIGIGVADDGSITDSAAIAEPLVSQMMSGSRPGTDDTFGVRRLVSELANNAVVAVGGAEPATPTAVSISDPRPAAAGDITETNPWVVGVAITDTAGRCTWSVMFGTDPLYGYTPPSAATGPCTGDAAASTYQP